MKAIKDKIIIYVQKVLAFSMAAENFFASDIVKKKILSIDSL